MHVVCKQSIRDQYSNNIQSKQHKYSKSKQSEQENNLLIQSVLKNTQNLSLHKLDQSTVQKKKQSTHSIKNQQNNLNKRAMTITHLSKINKTVPKRQNLGQERELTGGAAAVSDAGDAFQRGSGHCE
jgi:hypothetical protein